jgi:hypothetical protein
VFTSESNAKKTPDCFVAPGPAGTGTIRVEHVLGISRGTPALCGAGDAS